MTTEQNKEVLGEMINQLNADNRRYVYAIIQALLFAQETIEKAGEAEQSA